MDLTGFGSIADFLNGIVSRVWPDKTKQQELQADIQKAILEGNLQEIQAAWDNAKAQIAVNQQEAASANLFVAGWRPFIGWVCGTAFAWAFVLQPLTIFILTATHSAFDPKGLPQLDTSAMMPVLLGMLGLGGLRTLEKVRGAAQKGVL